MSALAQLTKHVEAMERGQYPQGSGDGNEAVKSLMNRICGTPWETAEDRYHAQSLIARLFRLRDGNGHAGADSQKSDAPGTSPPAPVVSPPALTAEVIKRWRMKHKSA